MPLSERLEIRLDPILMERLRREGKRKGMSVSEFIREVLISHLKKEKGSRSKAASALCSLKGPTADWEKMKREIEAGYLD